MEKQTTHDTFKVRFGPWGYFSGVPEILGATFMADDNIVLVDHANRRLTILDPAYKELDHHELSERPHDVCCVGPDEVCLAMGEKKAVERMKIRVNGARTRTTSPRLYISVGQFCRGVGCCDDRLYVACGGGRGEGPGCVYIYTTTGKLLHTWDKDRTGKLIFSGPCGFAFSTEGSRIHVADSRYGVITLNKQGEVMWRFNDSELKEQYRSVCVDGDNNV